MKRKWKKIALDVFILFSRLRELWKVIWIFAKHFRWLHVLHFSGMIWRLEIHPLYPAKDSIASTTPQQSGTQEVTARATSTAPASSPSEIWKSENSPLLSFARNCQKALEITYFEDEGVSNCRGCHGSSGKDYLFVGKLGKIGLLIYFGEIFGRGTRKSLRKRFLRPFLSLTFSTRSNAI